MSRSNLSQCCVCHAWSRFHEIYTEKRKNSISIKFRYFHCLSHSPLYGTKTVLLFWIFNWRDQIGIRERSIIRVFMFYLARVQVRFLQHHKLRFPFVYNSYLQNKASRKLTVFPATRFRSFMTKVPAKQSNRLIFTWYGPSPWKS